MFQPAYYLGRRVHVARPKSHPAIYVYTFVKQQRVKPNGELSRIPLIRLAKSEAFWHA